MTYIYQYDTDFTIEKEHVQEAYDALVIAARGRRGERDASGYDEVNPKWKDLRDVLDRWDFSFDENDEEIDEGGILSLVYNGEKESSRTDELFGILAPFVKPGSQICFYTDEGEHVRYVFAHGLVFCQDGEVIFPDVPNVPNFWSMPSQVQTAILEQIKRGAPDDEE